MVIYLKGEGKEGKAGAEGVRRQGLL